MAKFDKAAAKAGVAKAVAPAPAAKAAAAPAAKAAAAPAAKAPAAQLVTLEDKKKFILKHEMKIDDAQEAVGDEPNRAKKKELDAALKKLQQDETYVKTLKEIKEIEAQAAKDAERAAITAKATDKKGAKSSSKVEKASAPVLNPDEKADAAVMAEIDAALAGKDAAAKASAVARLGSLAAATPFVLPRLEKLVALFADSKLGSPAVKAASAIVEAVSPAGHGVAAIAVPALLTGMEDKKWKTKASCIEVLSPCLRQMGEHTPAQLAVCLPLIVPKLAEAALEVRAEIRTATGAVLREIGALVASPEIKQLSQELVTALAEPTNQKHTQSVLAKMGNQTFLSLIDPASLSLLMPVVVRGLKERDSMSKKWSAQIFGSTSMLVQDVDSMQPYLKSVIPMMKEALTDPVAEVAREAAKAFGILEQVLPDYSRQYNQPYLFDKLRNGEIGEQLGVALALAEVLLKMDKTRAAELFPEIEAGATDEKASVRRGFLELLEAIPHAMKMDFVPYIKRLFPAMLMGISGDKDKDEDAGLKAATSLVARFGDLCPDLLLPAFESVYAATLHADSNEERNRQQVVRDKTAMLLGKLVDKVLEHKKFGQDLLTTEDCSNKAVRESILVLVFMMRSDADASVKRYANGAWKNAGGAPKLQKIISPSIEKMLLRMRAGELGLGAQKHAAKVTEELVKAGEMEAPAGDDPAPAARFAFAPPSDRVAGSASADIASGKVSTVASGADFARQTSGQGSDGQDHFRSHAAFSSLPADVLSFCSTIASSAILEGRKKKHSGPKIAASVAQSLQAFVQVYGGDATGTLEQELPAVSEAVVRTVMGEAFDAQGGAGAGDGEMLLYVENLLLMYGAGHLLLKDTTLEMKKNHRYGVVGQNGAGKTTLMKEIANHRIVGMPQDLKCVHVDDSKLGLMSKSCLSSLEYCIKMAKDIGVETTGREMLLEVGFKESMLDEPVADLSTGWRMRLTLGVAMLKHADLVLLDEPTNHLDEESVEWLGDYVNSISNSSVMVISHEPKFLNKICTDIMAYVDRKLEYTPGDFTAFAARKGLSKEQIDAMLSGNLSFDTKKADEEGEEGTEGAGPTAAPPVAGPPKLSFPIPGSMEGVKSGSRAVLEAKSLSFRFSSDKDYLVKDCNVKLSLNSRVAICGRNGCGKSTLMTLLCSEASASENKDGSFGEVWRHCNLRMAYMKQDHLKSLGPFFDTSPFVYITQRFKDGYDGDLQKRLIEPESEEEAERRKALAKEHGKYGNEVEELVSRTKIGSELAYEVRWKGLDDPKQNTMEKMSKLKMMGLDKVVIACDERIAAKAAGLDQRPLTRREVVRHCEAFGIDEEMCCNRQIRGFSAGQKVRLSLAAMFWTKPHLIAVDEPTNYLDVETVEALAKALNTFRGGILMIEPKTDFVERICNEKWHMEDGVITVEKLKNGAKRQA
jgi:ATPase subunit of ABC transporter with duplicated ATPase domains